MNNRHLAVMIREVAARFPERIALQIRKDGKLISTSYAELIQRVNALAFALAGLGVKQGANVGIFSANRPEWAIADFSILTLRAVTVPIYGTNTGKQAEYIINDASVSVIFAGDQEQYDKVKSYMNDLSPLKKIIAMDDSIQLSGEDSFYMSSLISQGIGAGSGEVVESLTGAEADELCSIIYTSGTTGDPKGVMLSHNNFYHQIESINANFNLSENDRSLAFIPLSHVYERAWSYVVFSNGAQNNYCDDLKKVLEAMKDVKPTAMVSVPRLYEKIYAAVTDRLERGGLAKRTIFKLALWIGRRYNSRRFKNRWISPFLRFRYSIADSLILSKIRDVVGGDKNFFSAGGAPLSRDIEEFFFSAGLLICQGYGLSETSPVLACNTPSAFRFGTVGKPLDGVSLRVDSETGEIQAKGPNVMSGYYKRPDDTKEAFTEDGWFRTGDVGLIDSDGFVKITDRIKDIIITSGGKNIAPLRIETIVGVDHYIEQICTIGDKRKFVSALVVPNFAALEEYAAEQKIEFSTREELVKNDRIRDFFKNRIAMNSGDLSQYETIKRFTLLPREFTQESGELTPSLKIKRQEIMKRFAGIIEMMYAE